MNSFRHGFRALLFAGSLGLHVSAAAFGFVYGIAVDWGLSRMQEQSLRRLDVGLVVLEKTWSRFDYLPALLETTPSVRALLATPDDVSLRDQANRALARINAIAGLAIERNKATQRELAPD